MLSTASPNTWAPHCLLKPSGPVEHRGSPHAMPKDSQSGIPKRQLLLRVLATVPDRRPLGEGQRWSPASLRDLVKSQDLSQLWALPWSLAVSTEEDMTTPSILPNTRVIRGLSWGRDYLESNGAEAESEPWSPTF